MCIRDRYQKNPTGYFDSVELMELDTMIGGKGNLAAANNVAGKQFLSMESLTSASDHPVWFEALREINANLSDGINRIILHGIPFTKSWTGVNNDLPGWTFMSYGCWAPRQPVSYTHLDVYKRQPL